MFEIKHLSYIYNKETAFKVVANDDINLSINDGEVVGIVGETGSGKSTFLKLLSGILKPFSGQILVDGKIIDFNNFTVGMVFQYPEHQLFAGTVYDDIAFGPRNLRKTKEETNLIVNKAIKFVDLPSKILIESPFNLSGGEKRRVAIAGVVAMEPKVLILDEPTASLDLKSRNLLIKQLKDYHKEKGTTIILVSHDMNDIIDLCDRVILMKAGKVEKYLNTMDFFYKTENLNSFGIKIPPIIEIVKILKNKGYKISSNIKNVEEAEKEILKLIGGN